jgi:hypothetical protein
MRKSVRAALCAAAAMLAQGTASATVIEIKNGDFESGTPLSNGDARTNAQRPIEGWSAATGSAVGRWNPTNGSFGDEAAHGHVVYTGGVGVIAQQNAGMLAQVVEGQKLRANTRYVLTADVGKSYGATSYWAYQFGLISNFGAPDAFVLGKTAGEPVTAGSFKTISFTFETGDSGPGIGKSFAIAFGGGSSPFGDLVVYDNIKLEAFSLAGVPEPASWAMMIGGFGLAGIAARRRRPLRALA